MVKIGFDPEKYSIFDAYQFVMDEGKQRIKEKENDREFQIDLMCAVNGIKRK